MPQMTHSSPFYRIYQFFFAVFAKPTAADLEIVRQILSSGEAAIFARLQLSEQAHAIEVYKKVTAPAAEPALRKAALLHDVGKAKHPLRLWERIIIVVGPKIFGDKVTQWETRPPKGWARPFVIRAQHPAWGAEMAEKAGSSHEVINLIRKHQVKITQPPQNEEEKVLLVLQAADDQS